jgi:pimeloyl-ACP methyl ester carboxylesterase
VTDFYNTTYYENATTVDSAGVNLRVARFGPADGAPVLLLHGWPDSAELWTGSVGPLVSAGYGVITPDQRGFAGSDKPAGVDDYGLLTLVGDATAVLDAMDVESAHIVGHDWGAAVAWALGTFVPDRVRSLTAVSVGHPSSFARAGVEQKMLSWYMLAFQFPDVTEQWLMRDDWAMFRTFLASHPNLDSIIGHLAEPGALTASLNWYRANVPPESLLGEPMDLPPCAPDVMGVWSSGDLALTEIQMTGSEAYVAGDWRYERIEGASHWLQLDATDQFNELLLDWLGRH